MIHRSRKWPEGSIAAEEGSHPHKSICFMCSQETGAQQRENQSQLETSDYEKFRIYG